MLLAINALAQEPNTAALKGSNGKHSFIVRLTERPFSKEDHEIRRTSEGHYEIDGKKEWRESKATVRDKQSFLASMRA